MHKMFASTAAIVAAQMLLQIIGSNAKVLHNNIYLIDKSFSKQKFEYRNGMNWTEYQPLEVIYDFMHELNEKFPKLTKLTTIGETYEKRELKVLRVSENPKYYKKIWIDGGIHAREWITPATVTYIMHQLLTNWRNQPKHLRKLTWYFMPVMNPDGYVYSWHKDRNWRKNRSPTTNPECPGVDLNRNFDIGWDTIGSSPDPCEDNYHGPSVGSELETQAVTKFLLKNKRNLESFLTFHSYSQVLIYPWIYQNKLVKDAADLQSVGDLAANRIKAKTGSDYNAIPGIYFNYVVGGSSQDWSRKTLGVKYVYSVELRDKGQHGFELPSYEIIPTGQEGFIVAYTVAEAVGADSTSKSLVYRRK